MSVVVVAPHADDELFGCGGAIQKHAGNGDDIVCILVACSDVEMRHAGTVYGATREAEFVDSVSALTGGRGRPVVLRFQDTRLDTVPQIDLVRAIEDEFAKWRPGTIYIPEPGYHQDHRAVHAACVAALRPTGLHQPGMVYSYEVPTSIWAGGDDQFAPNVFLDIAGDPLDRKMRILRDVYRSQYSEDRGALGAAGIRRHAQYRGIQAGLEAAEAFRLLRWIVP